MIKGSIQQSSGEGVKKWSANTVSNRLNNASLSVASLESRIVTWKDSGLVSFSDLALQFWIVFLQISFISYLRLLFYETWNSILSYSLKGWGEREREREELSPAAITTAKKEWRMWRVFTQQSILQLLALNKSLHCLICSNSKDKLSRLWTLYFCLYLHLVLLLGCFLSLFDFVFALKSKIQVLNLKINWYIVESMCDQKNQNHFSFQTKVLKWIAILAKWGHYSDMSNSPSGCKRLQDLLITLW